MHPPRDPDSALRDLLERYGALIRHVVRRVGGATVSHSADDVAQTVAMNIWQAMSREQTVDYPASYIYKAAVRETVRAVRKELARLRTHASLDDATNAPLPAGTPDPERTAMSAELGARIERVVATLPSDRQLAVRAHLMGYAVDEMMTLHGWSYQKTRNLVARGMADLRQGLTRGGADE